MAHSFRLPVLLLVCVSSIYYGDGRAQVRIIRFRFRKRFDAF